MRLRVPGRLEIMTTIAEDLVLLLHDSHSGRPLVDATERDRVVGGALLLDLAAAGRVTADGTGARAKLSAVVGKPMPDALLDGALARLGTAPVRAQRAVERLSRGAREQVLHRLAERGVLREVSGRTLGIFPRTSWPAADPAPREALRARLSAVLVDGAAPQGNEAALVSLLHAVKAEHKIVDGSRSALRARAADVAQGDWAGDAVRKAVQAVQASVMVAVTAAVAAGAASSG